MPETISLNALPNNLSPGSFRIAFASDGHTLIDATSTPSISAARELLKRAHPPETILQLAFPMSSSSTAPYSDTIQNAGNFIADAPNPPNPQALAARVVKT